MNGIVPLISLIFEVRYQINSRSHGRWRRLASGESSRLVVGGLVGIGGMDGSASALAPPVWLRKADH